MKRGLIPGGLVVAFLLAASLWAQDGDLHCPLYPSQQRQEDQLRLKRQLEFRRYSEYQKANKSPRTAAETRPASANFIDDYVFAQAVNDNVPIAVRTTDYEFVRRIYIDITGHIPTANQVTNFISDSNPNKRDALIDALLASPAYVDRWTQWYGDQFKVGTNYYNVISTVSRNLFYNFVRDFVERDRPYNEFAAQLISASGDSYKSGPVNYIVRGFQQGDPVQDTWDATTNYMTQNFLGVQTLCVSCHDGRRHLEPINLYLQAKRRNDFWQQAAFLSRTNYAQKAVNAYGASNHMIVTDSGAGGYSTVIASNNLGQRPQRNGGPYAPSYMFGGAKPASSDWRGELARMITSDRQFARAAVNYIWARMFSVGIVDPPDQWDLSRLDPKNPPAPETGFSLQPSNPALLEALASEFISSGYSVKHMIQIMAQSNAYQLSSAPPAGWNVAFEPYFTKHIPRRLTAEEVFDSVNIATGTETPMYVEGFDRPLMYATQLPDTTEPRSDGTITTFLSQFGRGDWLSAPRNSTSTVLQVLFLMNDSQIVNRTLGSGVGSRSTRVASLLGTNKSEDEMVQSLYLSTLGRLPSDNEKAALAKNRTSRSSREIWLTDLQWALVNKLDFIFNY